MSGLKSHCQSCGAPLTLTWVDLGLSPLANANVSQENADHEDPRYPLHARVCEECFLVQVDSVVAPEHIFNEDYAYFSSYSDSWLEHCRNYVESMIGRFGLNDESMVVEIASNDGYMLQYFVERNIPVLGIEPSANTAQIAKARGVPTVVRFFGKNAAADLVDEGKAADLLAAKNVLAHVPDINDFVSGVALILKPEGVFTVEFPHLLNAIKYVQFDTIYHEHFTYLSLLAIENICERHSLRVFDVAELPTHGGSLRVFICNKDAHYPTEQGVSIVREKERVAQLGAAEGYSGFDQRVRRVREDFLTFLAKARAEGRRVAAYGAAAKGNTLLNYAGVGADEILAIADRNPVKQGRLTPGGHIPIVSPAHLLQLRPDYVIILPWNLKQEIMDQLENIRSWGGRFVTVIPELVVE